MRWPSAAWPQPAEPVTFVRAGSTVIGPGEPILIPPDVGNVGYEAELAVVIGRRALRVERDQAMRHVAGYAAHNDVSGSDLIKGDGGNFVRGKNLPASAPLGPWLATPDEVPDPYRVRIRLDIDGRPLQDGSTATMLFNIADLISGSSYRMPLEPGDVIATGTPAGVAAMHRPGLAAPGATVTVAVEGLGRLSTRSQRGEPFLDLNRRSCSPTPSTRPCGRCSPSTARWCSRPTRRRRRWRGWSPTSTAWSCARSCRRTCSTSARLRAVVRHGVGLDMIPVEAATARGIPVANLPGSNTQPSPSTAGRDAAPAARPGRHRHAHAQRRLGRGPAARRRGTELGGSVCGIVGVGAIGRRVADIARGLGMRVLGLTRRAEGLPAMSGRRKAALFAQADVVVLSCPLNDATRGLVDAATMAAMKPTALLINMSRGPVMDTAAVVAALREGRLGGAAMDVHDKQPLTGQEPVFDAPNLLLTPHVAGITATSMRAMSQAPSPRCWRCCAANGRQRRQSRGLQIATPITKIEHHAHSRHPRRADLVSRSRRQVRPAGHRPQRQARRGAGARRDRRGPRRLGRGAPRPLPRRRREAGRHHDARAGAGLRCADVAGVWARVYRMQLASHGMGAAAALALSGLDMALWDLRCQATGMPLYRLLGGSAKPIKAYAGGIALGWQEPALLAEEARRHVAAATAR